jgi:hypothetical protein
MRSDHDGDCVIEVVLRNGRILRLSEGVANTGGAAGRRAGGMRIMIPVPTGTQIWVACGATDMRRYALHTNMLSPRGERMHAMERWVSVSIIVGALKVIQHGDRLIGSTEVASRQSQR